MKILVTGAKGFVGSNLCEALRAIGEGRDSRARYRTLLPLEICTYDRNSSPEELAAFCDGCDFVFHLAGVNRPDDPSGFADNVNALTMVLTQLEKARNNCPVMLSSSVQAGLEGRFSESIYGQSKLVAESLLREYGERCRTDVLIYRLPNIFGKWSRPNYNSAVATFCDAIANEREFTVTDPSVELELLYIDDLVGELLSALLGEEHREGDFCVAGPTYKVTLGRIVELLQGFKASRENLSVPDISADSFPMKLYSTFVSYLDAENIAYPLHAKTDSRGSFIEFMRTPERGQLSVNITKPGITKGQHWHHSKWEKFLVVSGEGLIRERRIGTDADDKPFPVNEYRVSGTDPTVVDMLPGSTHSITNLSETDDLVTLIWANECFDPENPDTFYEEV